MIHVFYKPSEYDLKVIGHAGTADYGKDLVCCAVSALTYSLEVHLQLHPEYRAETKRYQKEASFHAKANPKLLYDTRCSEVFDTIVDGLKLLSEQFPEAVFYNEEEGRTD